MKRKLALILAAIILLTVPNIITYAAENVVTNFDEFMEALNSSSTITIGGTVEVPNGTVINMSNKQIKRQDDFTEPMFVLLPGDALTVLAFAKYDGNNLFGGNFITVNCDASFPGLNVQNHRSVENGGVLRAVDGNVTVDYAYAMNNIVTTSGSGIIAVEPNATLTINESDFNSNVSTDGLINNRGNVFINGSSARSTSFSGNVSQGRGGVLSNIGGYADINEYVEFSENVARYEASDIYNEGIIDLNLDNFYYDFADNRLNKDNYTNLQATEIFDNQRTSLVHLNYIDFYIQALNRIPDPIEPPIIITPSPEPSIEPTESPLPPEISPSPTPEPEGTPTTQPTESPTPEIINPTPTPSQKPTETPKPIETPTPTPIPVPSDKPITTPLPSESPTPSPLPTEEPTATTTPEPTDEIPTTEKPTETPIPQESEEPTDNNDNEDKEEEIIPTPIPIPDKENTDEGEKPSPSPSASPLPSDLPNEDDSSNGDDDEDGTEKPTATRKPTRTPRPTQPPLYAYTLPALPTGEPIEDVPSNITTDEPPIDDSISVPENTLTTDDIIEIEAPPFDTVELQFLIGLDGYVYNGKLYHLEAAPFLASNGRTMISIRVIAESFGTSVEWLQDTKTALIRKDDLILAIIVDEPIPNGMGTAAIVENRVYVPLRYVSEMLGATVSFDEKTGLITIYATINLEPSIKYP